MASLLDCTTDIKNIGLIRCNKLPQMPKLIIETPPDFYLSPEDAVDPEKWQDALKAAKGVRIYLFPEADNFEDKSEAAVYQTTPLSVIPVRPGRYQQMYSFSKSLCYHKAMFSHSGKGNRIFILDIANQLFGKLNSDGNFQGFLLSLFNMEKLIISNGTVATVSPLYLVLADNTEIDLSGVLIDGTFVLSLYPLTDVDVTAVGDVDSVTVTVMTDCDNTPVLGLVAADFVALTAGGVVQAITASVDNGDGTYTLSKATDWVTGTVDLVAAADLSLIVGAYESLAPATLTIA
jgi:hypothetical protein